MFAPEHSITPKLPPVIDLFSGCGGLSLGFARVGFPLFASVDSNEAAIQTASLNLHNNPDMSPHSGAFVRDIRNLNPLDIITPALNENPVVIGGPPCQAYSMAGRGKLKSLGKDRIHTKDSRGNFYQDFLEFAIKVNASAIVMENVPASMDYGGQNIPEIACKKLEEYGYRAKWTILNAANYGVPQLRERMFLIAVQNDLEMVHTIPEPSHSNPDKNRYPRRFRFEKISDRCDYFVMPPENAASKAWVTVGEAISDLPKLLPSADTPYHLAKPLEAKPYAEYPSNDYQKSLRGQKKTCSGNGFRRTLRDFKIFDRMLPNDDYRQASEIAEMLLQDKLKASGTRKETNPERYALLRKQFVPPYSLNKFHDKWKKLNRDYVSHTLPAHLGTDTYSHIHPWEPRGISVREAARLQSFPDNFIFPVSMGDAFKQIGNAVPPLLAEVLALSLKNVF